MTNFKTLGKVLLGSTVLTMFASGSAYAQTKTEANELVSNTFRLEYSVGGVSAPPIDSSDPGVNGAPPATTFRVDRLIDLSVTTTTPTVSVNPGAANQDLEFTVVNEGNDDQAYTLNVVADGGNSAEVTDSTPSLVYFIDAVGAGEGTLGAEDGTEQTYDPANPPVLAPDQILFVRVRRDIGVAAVDGDSAQYTLVADTRDPVTFADVTADTDGNDNDVTENVLIDGATTSEESATNGGVGQGDQSAVATFNISGADVAGTKTVSVFNQDGAGNCTFPGTGGGANDYAVPGACVQYVITMTNSGSAAATDINVADTLPDELTFQAAQSSGDFTGTPVIAGATAGDDCNAGACALTLTGVSLPAPTGGATSTSGTLTIRALIK